MSYELVGAALPSGYLIVYDEFRDFQHDTKKIRARCYQLSLSALDSRAEYTCIDREITYQSLRDAQFPIEMDSRADMAHALVREAPDAVHQRCVLVKKSDYDHVVTRARADRYSSRWKALAQEKATNRRRRPLP